MEALLPQLVDVGGPVAGMIITIAGCWRLFNSVWKTTADNLRESADYARQENEGLRDRVDEVEKRNAELAAHVAALELERAQWVVERGRLELRIQILEEKLSAVVAATEKGQP